MKSIQDVQAWLLLRIETSSFRDRYRATKPMIISHQINSLLATFPWFTCISRRFNDRHGFARVRAALHTYTYVRSFTRPAKRKDPGTGERFGKMTKIYQLRSTVNDQLGSSRAVSPMRRNPMTSFRAPKAIN